MGLLYEHRFAVLISPVDQLVGSILIGWLDSSAMSAGKVFKMKLDLFYMKQELMTTEHFLVKCVVRLWLDTQNTTII